MYWIRVLTLIGIASVLGCGSGALKGEKVEAPKIPAKEAVKNALKPIAESGQGSSAVGAIKNELKKLKESDPALAEELSKDADELMSTRLSPEEVKAKANAMIQKLDGAKK
jgi:hypothetical protein